MTNPFAPAVLRLVDQSLADAADALRKALRENTRARRNMAALIEEAAASEAKAKRKARA